MTPDANALAETRTTFASQRTDLAVERTSEALVRTRLAYERTLMAAVRTATSLISFGFTIYKFFQYLRDGSGGAAAAEERLLNPRAVALAMIGLGVGFLVLATVDHRRAMNELREVYRQYGAFPRSIAAILALVLSTVGLFGLVLVFFHQ